MFLINPPSGPLFITAKCLPAASVGDVVAVTSSGVVSLATQSVIATTPAVGLIKSKSDSTTAKVQLSGLFREASGLTPGEVYVGNDGLVSQDGFANFPKPVDDAKTIQQTIGIALDATTILVSPSRTQVPRLYGQTLSGSGSTFTTSIPFVSECALRESLRRNGVVQQSGAIGCDYQVSESVPGSGYDTITLNQALIASESLRIDFQPF